MYWFFLIIFIVTVLVPDLVRSDFLYFSETRVEEMLIFILGASIFTIFIKDEQQILFHKKEKEEDQKRIDQTVKDLVESYGYIGEVNRKMDILTNIALGFSDQTVLSKAHEKETYTSIVSAASSLLKADFTCLRFVDTKTWQTKKEFRSQGSGNLVKNSELTKMEEGINIKKVEDCLIISSNQKIKDIKGYFIVCGYDSEEENSLKNLEILKVFASQALFLYAYTHSQEYIEESTRS